MKLFQKTDQGLKTHKKKPLTSRKSFAFLHSPLRTKNYKFFLITKIIYYTSGMLMIVLRWSEGRKLQMNVLVY